MPNRSTHAWVGVAVGVGMAATRVAHLPRSQALPEVIGAMTGGFLGGILPDVLEPATSPNHRKMAHSLIAAGGLTLARVTETQATCRRRADSLEQQALYLPQGCPQRNHAEFVAMLWRLLAGMILGLVGGYASHLLLDATTSRGLPLLGRLE
jgi:membrane-bound metal-dependent hydrolase YbcI (DUF457 family)